MSKVDIDGVTYPYIKIEITDEKIAEKIGVNLSHLYLYIDEHKNMGRICPYGNAYKVIKDTANKLMGKKHIKISKRQVTSLRKYYLNLTAKKFIKIPYTLYYIFEAIFEIVDGLKKDYPLPDDLEVFVGKIRREAFYYEQSESFKEWYKQNRNDISKGLFDDIFAGNTILSKEF